MHPMNTVSGLTKYFWFARFYDFLEPKRVVFFSIVPTSSLRSSAFSLTAGLSYTCQFLDLIAFFLDVTLPKDVSCR